jgi:hypothetical protein
VYAKNPPPIINNSLKGQKMNKVAVDEEEKMGV